MSMMPGFPGQQSPPEHQPGQTPVVVVQQPAPPPAPPAGDFISRQEFERLLNEERERVRQEEKQKLYPQIDELKTHVQTLAQEREARLAAEQEAERQRQEEAERQRQQELSLQQQFEEYRSAQERRFAQLEEERERERMLRQKEMEFAALAAYRARRVAEESDNIIPELQDLVSGNSEQEIEQSINTLKERTAQVLAQFQAVRGQQQQQMRPPMPMTGQPAMDMQGAVGGAGTTREFTLDELRDMTMEDYARLRPALLNAQSEQVRQHGLYGAR